jgi:hypothetical protein
MRSVEVSNVCMICKEKIEDKETVSYVVEATVTNRRLNDTYQRRDNSTEWEKLPSYYDDKVRILERDEHPSKPQFACHKECMAGLIKESNTKRINDDNLEAVVAAVEEAMKKISDEIFKEKVQKGL